MILSTYVTLWKTGKVAFPRGLGQANEGGRFGRARRRAEKKPSYIFPPAFPSPTSFRY